MENDGHKVALLHYWLLTMRGGERVFAELCTLFPKADVYTHACNRDRLVPEITGHPIYESFVSRLPGARQACQRYLPLMPAAQRRWDLSGYSLIISSESGPVKGIRKPEGCRHICYCHTPMRYVWDMHDEYFRKASLAGKAAMRLFRDPMRRYDLKSAQCVDQFVANSRFVAERIRRAYGRESAVVYPPVNTDFFGSAHERERSYFLLAGQLTGYKQPQLVVRAFARLNERLIVAGAGEELPKLRAIATPNVEFVVAPDDEELRDLYAGARALIFPGVEDFGIIPVEAQAAGCPVIAFRAGGALESVVENHTGLFFDEQSEASLLGAVEEFRGRRFSPEELKENAAHFSREQFRKEMGRIIAEYGC
ncbi:MAG: glycosyltransferase [Lentisphaeria bacterium]|nr:glycosyltransferase [Lentisphaeria bacterium]